MFFFKKNKKNDFDEVYDKLFDKIDLWLTKPNANNMQITQYNAAQKKKNFIDDNQDARMFLVSIITKMESMKNKDKGELKALKSLEQAFDAFNAIGNEKINTADAIKDIHNKFATEKKAKDKIIDPELQTLYKRFEDLTGYKCVAEIGSIVDKRDNKL